MNYSTRIKLIFSIFGENKSFLNGSSLKPFWEEGSIVINTNITPSELSWEYETKFIETQFLDEISDVFIQKIEKFEKDLVELVREYKLTTKIYFVIEVVDENKPSLFLNKNILNFITNLNGEIDIDLYLVNSDG